MFNRRSKRFVLILLIAVLALCAQALAETMTVYVATEGAKVYDAEGRARGTLPVDTELSLTGVKGRICRVEREGRVAYMLKDDLSQSPVSQSASPENAAPEKGVAAYVNKDGAVVYDANGKTEGTLPLNAEVTVVAVKKGVCRVTCEGKTGYMRKADLSAEKVQPQATAPCATAYVNKDGAKVIDIDGSTLATLSVNDSVTVTAVKNGVSRVTAGGRTGYMSSEDLSCDKVSVQPTATPAPAADSAPSGGSTVTPAKGSARKMDWWTSDIQTIFARGVVAQITDVETGLSWREKRFGGTNHADCQPLTAADTAAMKKAYGGKWSWNRRAVFVTIDGVNYAASINGMPHGGGSIKDNDFNGHHCIHFTNSRTHGSNKVCPLHQAAIEKAASTTLK